VAQAQVDGHGGRDDQDGRGDGGARVPQHRAARRLVDAEEELADGMFLLRVVAADRHLVDDPARPARPEVQPVHAAEHHAQRGIEGEGEAGRDEHRQVLRPRQRPEEPPFLVDQREDREERYRDHQQREEHRGPDFQEGLQTHRVEVALAAAVLPPLELLVGVLHLDDGAVDQDADGDGDSRQRHHVRGDTQERHGDEGQQHRDRDRDDGDDRGRDVPQEDQDDEADDQHLQQQLVLQVVDRALDQVRPVVGGDDPDALRQRGLDLREPRLDAVDHGACVLGVPHHDDAADGVAQAVEIADAAPDLGSERDLSHVAEQHGRAALVRLQDDLLEIAHVLHVATPAHHVLAAGELDEAPAHLVVARAHRVRDVHDREVVRLQAVGVYRDLVLLDEPSDRRHLRHSRHRLKAVPQVPVLERSQVRRGQAAGVVHEGVLEDPADAGSVRPELGLDAGREQRLDLAQVLEDAAARPVDVRAVLEDHVDVAEAEVREAADDLDVGCPEERGHDGVGDLVLHDVRAAVPAGVDDDLRVRQVGDRIDGDVLKGVDPVRDGHRRHHQDQHPVVGAEADDRADHLPTISAARRGVVDVRRVGASPPRGWDGERSAAIFICRSPLRAVASSTAGASE
jgi:hypothetical protein